MPEGFCLTTRLLEEFIHLNALENDLMMLREAINNGDFPSAIIQTIQGGIQNGKFPDGFIQKLEQNLKRIAPGNVVVRSSAVFEDGDRHSFAGMLDTALSVPAQADPVLAAIRRVWASLFHERLIRYVIENRLNPALLKMGVIVQRMVFAEKSGVAFSINPVNDDPEFVYVEETSAGVEKVVSGEVQPEIHTIHKRINAFENPQADWLKPLSSSVAQIESHIGQPVDVEWAWARNQLYILQARPITTKDANKITIWTDENVGEVLPEVVTPLTWSIVGPMTNISFNWIRNFLGISVGKENLFRLIHGKAYFNHTLFNKSLAQIFGNAFVPIFAIQGLVRRASLFFKQIPILLRFAWICMWLLFRSKAALNRKPRKKTDDDEAENINLEIRQIIHLESELMRLHVANTFVGEITYQVLVGLSSRLKVQNNGNRPYDWISGIGETASAESGLAFQRIAREIGRRNRNSAVDLTKSNELSLLIKNDSVLRSVMEDFLSKFGHMSDQEFELRHPRWGEHPESLYRVLSNIVLELENDENAITVARQHKEATKPLSNDENANMMIKLIVWLSKIFNRNRENLKQAFVKEHYQLKQFLLTKAQMLCNSGFLPSERSIYFLTMTEIEELTILRPQVEKNHYLRVIMQREDEYRGNRIFKHPGRWLEKEGEFVAAEFSDHSKGGMLYGIPCSSGNAEGMARVLNSFEEGQKLIPGEILVVYSANPGWTPLFLIAKGIICEIGGALSHSAIIAREYGIPMVAAVKNITSRLKTGDRVRIDGTRGYVELVESKGKSFSSKTTTAT